MKGGQNHDENKHEQTDEKIRSGRGWRFGSVYGMQP